MANISRRENGRWRARYRDEAGKEHARHFGRKADAQRWLDEVTAMVVTGTYVDPDAGRVTFDAWFAEWSSRQVWAPMTEVQADLVRRSVPFGTVPLVHLRPSHLETWVKQMQAKGYAATTVGTRMMTVRAALKAAVRDRRLVGDPSDGVVLPRRRRREAVMQVATSEQVGALLAATEPRMRAFIGLCAFAGLRLGEASAMSLGEIDFEQRRLHVVRQVQKRRGGPSELRPPKYESVRTVFAPDELLGDLRLHLDRFALDSPAGWLFTAASGGPIPPTTVHHWWVRTAAAARVSGVTVHSLRHYFASGLIAAGRDVVTVQRALGHKSPSVTLDTYSHLWPSAEDRTREAAAGLAADAWRFAAADCLRTEGSEQPADLQ